MEDKLKEALNKINGIIAKEDSYPFCRLDLFSDGSGWVSAKDGSIKNVFDEGSHDEPKRRKVISIKSHLPALVQMYEFIDEHQEPVDWSCYIKDVKFKLKCEEHLEKDTPLTHIINDWIDSLVAGYICHFGTFIAGKYSYIDLSMISSLSIKLRNIEGFEEGSWHDTIVIYDYFKNRV